MRGGSEQLRGRFSQARVKRCHCAKSTDLGKESFALANNVPIECLTVMYPLFEQRSVASSVLCPPCGVSSRKFDKAIVYCLAYTILIFLAFMGRRMHFPEGETKGDHLLNSFVTISHV